MQKVSVDCFRNTKASSCLGFNNKSKNNVQPYFTDGAHTLTGIGGLNRVKAGLSINLC